MKKAAITVINCIAIYCILLFRHGYIFGSGDQSEMMSYAKYLNDNTLHSKDFYIQSISQYTPNERYFFSWLMSLFGENMEAAAFIIHALATVFLILGLHRLAQKYVSTEGGAWLATIAPVLMFYNVNLGGNELYYNLLTPSYLAQVLGVWVFIFLLDYKLWHAYPLLILATYFHPLIGLQLWVLFTLILVITALRERNYAGLVLLSLPSLLFVFIVGKYIYDIQKGYNNGDVSTVKFFEILEFRAAHHYFPQYFPLKSWLILLPLWGLFYYQAQSFLKKLILITFAGLILYTLNIFIFKTTPPLSLQWFSTTIWLKTFALIFAVGYFEDVILGTKWEFYFNNKILINNVLYTFAIVGLVSMTPQLRVFKMKPYEFFFLNENNNEIDIALRARDYTPPDALFLMPADLSEFRYWSERSNYVDYKAANHRKTAFAEWYERIQKVYKINIENRRKGDDLSATANANFQKLTETEFRQLTDKQGITHILTYKTHILSFNKIVENEKYVIYRL